MSGGEKKALAIVNPANVRKRGTTAFEVKLVGVFTIILFHFMLRLRWIWRTRICCIRLAASMYCRSILFSVLCSLFSSVQSSLVRFGSAQLSTVRNATECQTQWFSQSNTVLCMCARAPIRSLTLARKSVESIQCTGVCFLMVISFVLFGSVRFVCVFLLTDFLFQFQFSFLMFYCH